MNADIGTVEILIFVLIAFVLPAIVVYMDGKVWEPTKH